MRARTMLDKIWDAHEVVPETAETPAILYVDLHLVHEVTSPQAFKALVARGLKVRRPDRTVATADHVVPTLPRAPFADAEVKAQAAALADNCATAGIRHYGPGDARQGIVHVIGPEQGHTRPGMTIVCGDSHTSTHGAFGALAFGIGTSEVGHVLATQTLLQRKPKSFRVTIDGRLGRGVVAKDVILAVIAAIGTDGGTGHVLELAGSAVRGLGMDGRMTLCNMAIEAGARAGMVAPDDVTLEYLARTVPHSEASWDRAAPQWRAVASDERASFDRELIMDAAKIAPMITWGTSPGMGCAVDAPVPQRCDYMRLEAGKPATGTKVDVVFIGSCTNGRLADLRDAAAIFVGRKVAAGVRALVVPGSQAVKRQAEREGLAEIFRAAGAEWREPGCSLCIAMNGDKLQPGQLAVSTSNRNFAGRQGPGGRTILASPLTAAAAAVTGVVADPRPMMEG